MSRYAGKYKYYAYKRNRSMYAETATHNTSVEIPEELTDYL